MTTSTKFILILFIISLLGACKSEPAYKTVVVDFFIQHPEFSVTPATFDTLMELVLVKDAFNEGATFETVTEQVLVRDAYRSIRIMDVQYINMLADHEENLLCAVPCITYFPENQIERFEASATYTTRTYQKVVVNGTGVERPAEYASRQFLKKQTNASINPEPMEDLQPLRKIFRLPVNLDFEDYWEQYLLVLDMEDCGETITFEVVE